LGKICYNNYYRGGNRLIEFKNIRKAYKSNVVLNDFSMKIETGKLVAIIGESGCGKTTLLKMVNRLIKANSGSILIDGKKIEEMDVIRLRRNTGYIIQQVGLFPHMTIRENIELIEKLEKVDKEKVQETTLRLMKMVGLDPEEYLDRYPTELSGGQQQRIGIVRAFATNPEVVLMDEPFSALDPITRLDLQDEIAEIQSKVKKTIIFVTHDMDEAIKVADKICIMHEGEILQYDTPENILKNPVNDYVSNFVGQNRIWTSPEFIKVEDIMITKPVVSAEDVTLLKCLGKMRTFKVDSLIIIDHETKELKGVLKASQIRNVKDHDKLAGEIMKKNIATLSRGDTILDALTVVTENKISTVPVVDENNVLEGLVTRSSLITTLSQQYIDLKVDDEEDD